MGPGRAALLILGVILATLWGRAWWSADAEFEAGAQAEAAGDLETARARYLFAARWYAPGASRWREAADALWRMSSEAFNSDDLDTSLAAARDLRAAALATRGLTCPLCDRLPEANARIAALMARQQAGTPSARGRDQATLEAHHLKLLQINPGPALGWSLMVILGFLGWVGGAIMLIRRGLDAEARPQWPAVTRWGGLTLAAFAAWVVGLMNA